MKTKPIYSNLCLVLFSFLIFETASHTQAQSGYLPDGGNYGGAFESNVVKDYSEIRNPWPQQPVVQFMDSIYYWIWNTGINAWKLTPQKKTANYFYDSQNNIISKMDQNYSGGNWFNSSLYSNFYSNNQLDSELVQVSSGGWSNDYQIFHTYDVNGNKLSNNKMDWNGQWVNYQDEEFTYNLVTNKLTTRSYLFNWVSSLNYYQNGEKHTYTYINNQVIELWQLWNHNSNAWDNFERLTYSYDIINPSRLISLMQEDYSSNTWDKGTLQTITYNSNGNKVLNIIQSWNNNFSSWETYAKDTLIYDVNNDLLESIRFNWNFGTNVWDTSSHSLHTWDNNHNETSYWYQVWSVNGWLNKWISTYYFTSNDLLYSQARKSWNSAGTTISSGDSTSYYFNIVSSINENTDAMEAIRIFPNPCINQISIKLNKDISLTYPCVLSLFDISGKLLLQQDFQAGSMIDIGIFNKGIYLLQIKDIKRKVLNGKVVKT